MPTKVSKPTQPVHLVDGPASGRGFKYYQPLPVTLVVPVRILERMEWHDYDRGDKTHRGPTLYSHSPNCKCHNSYDV